MESQAIKRPANGMATNCKDAGNMGRVDMLALMLNMSDVP